jgi:hypothetical protein
MREGPLEEPRRLRRLRATLNDDFTGATLDRFEFEEPATA